MTEQKRLYNKNVIIRDNLITDITDAGDKSQLHEQMSAEEAEIIDCKTHIVTPGFINTHHHFYQILTRNLPEVQNAELFRLA